MQLQSGMNLQQWIGLLLLGWFLLMLGSCQGSSNDDDDDQPTAPIVFDGQYNVSFISAGLLRAAADFEIKDNAFQGFLTNIDKLKFGVQGTVAHDGQIQFTSIRVESTADIPITAQGKINADFTILGTYALANRNGTFTGFRYTAVGNEVKQFDGAYGVTFMRNNTKMASGCVKIENGVATANNIITVTGEIFQLRARVLADGKIVLNTQAGSLGTAVVGSGQISTDGKISGTYTLQDGQGTFAGSAQSFEALCRLPTPSPT